MKLGAGGKPGDTPTGNARRAERDQAPHEMQTRISRSALGPVAPIPYAQPLAGAGGLPGEPAEKHAPGDPVKSKQAI
jgi:hypothetical protein